MGVLILKQNKIMPNFSFYFHAKNCVHIVYVKGEFIQVSK